MRIKQLRWAREPRAAQPHRYAAKSGLWRASVVRMSWFPVSSSPTLAGGTGQRWEQQWTRR